MKIEIAKLEIYNEMDVVVSHRRATQIAKYAGISLSEQTRFATAVSEICRNVLEYSGKGEIRFNIHQNGIPSVEAEIKDEGKGISGIDKILARDPMQYKGRGLGLVFSRRLSDYFDLKTSSKGTTVILRKHIPKRDQPVSKLVIEGWKKHLLSEPSLSAYEELKVRNLQLLEITDELKQQKEKLDDQYEEIAVLNRRLQHHNTNMKDFTFAVSHDLRTPLTSLILSMSLIKGEDLPDDLRTNFEIAIRSVKRLENIIKGLMDILEIQNPAKHVVKELDLAVLVPGILDDFAPAFNDDSAEIQFNLAAATPLHYVEAFVQSIITNLVSNSIKYRRPDKLNISIETQPIPEGIRLVFRDNGKGIDLEKNMNRIFSPFTRFTNDVEGKGLGLYLIKTMLENNGGSIRVDSVVNEGTTFVLDFIHYRKIAE